MNKEQLQGSVKVIIGKMQEDFGNLLGSAEQQVLGLRKQVAGRAERRIGDLKELIAQANALKTLVSSSQMGFK